MQAAKCNDDLAVGEATIDVIAFVVSLKHLASHGRLLLLAFAALSILVGDDTAVRFLACCACP